MGFDFTVKYRQGALNRIADALSQRGEEDSTIEKAALFTLSHARKGIFEDLRKEIDTNKSLSSLRDRVIRGLRRALSGWFTMASSHFRIMHTFLLPLPWYNCCVEVSQFSTQGGPKDGVYLTDFYWTGWKKIDSRLRPTVPRLSEIHMGDTSAHGTSAAAAHSDNYLGPHLHGFCGKPTKGRREDGHFGCGQPLLEIWPFLVTSPPLDSFLGGRYFVQEVFRLHGLLESIVADRDPVFRSNFWRKLLRRPGMTILHHRLHPQSDGQTTVVNRTLEMYFRCLTRDRPKQWLSGLLWVEYCYNTSTQPLKPPRSR